jgi:hypothetical protein
MSHPERSGEEMDQTGSEMLKRLQNPEVSLIYHEDKLLAIDSPETRFFEEWERLEQAIIPEKAVRYFSQQVYARLTYHLQWFPRLGEIEDFRLCESRPHQNYHCEGLRALSFLFADETYDTIKFRRVEEFPQLKEYPKDSFRLGESACCFRDWRQGFLLGQVRFGEITADHPAVKQTLFKYSSDTDFIERLTKDVRHGPRSMLTMLRRFAKDWDIFLLPLRFFTHEAALDFIADQYGYRGRDLKRFRIVFLKGGDQKQSRGLKLTSAKPSIVDKWNENGIRLNAPAAAHHGYDARLLKKNLADRYKRKISI